MNITTIIQLDLAARGAAVQIGEAAVVWNIPEGGFSEKGVIPQRERPESANEYGKGNKVTHRGKCWVSLLDDNIWEEVT